MLLLGHLDVVNARQRGDSFAFLQRHEIGDRLAARITPGVTRIWQASYFPVRAADGSIIGVGSAGL